jgi:hypothetical protein
MLDDFIDDNEAADFQSAAPKRVFFGRFDFINSLGKVFEVLFVGIHFLRIVRVSLADDYSVRNIVFFSGVISTPDFIKDIDRLAGLSLSSLSCNLSLLVRGGNEKILKHNDLVIESSAKLNYSKRKLKIQEFLYRKLRS